ncbi:MAG TPA: LLM class flavin-dependent oxidoreductase [Acidimicrobiales bacterium]
MTDDTTDERIRTVRRKGPPAFVRLGLNVADFRPEGHANAFERLSELVRSAEAAGFDSFFSGDHLMSDKASPGGNWLELYSTLAALAARTTSIQLGGLVGAVLFRNPALLAKTVTTLDVISGGRAVFGIGSGSHEPEHIAYGYRFPTAADRLDILEETVRLVKAMFEQSSTTFHGTWVRADGAINLPPPVRAGGPPVLIGGKGRRRTLRLVARFADIANFTGDDEQVPELNEVLDGYCAELGRDPSTLSRTLFKPIILAKSRRAAEAQMTLWQRQHQDQLGFIIGSAEEVAGRVGNLLDAGIDGVIVQLPAARNTCEDIAGIGALLAPMFAR